MSKTYELFCKTCNEKLWVGQSTRLYPHWYLYTGEEQIKELEKFLKKHETHLLTFGDSEILSE